MSSDGVRCKICRNRSCDCEDVDEEYHIDGSDLIEIDGEVPQTTATHGHISHYVVPSAETKTLADAILAIERDVVYRGMSTIVIKEHGVHEIKSQTTTLSHPVTIIGDSDRHCAAVYWRRPRKGPMLSMGPPGDEVRGVGPFDIVVGTNNSIAVYGVDEEGERDAHLDPDFSNITEKREICFFTPDGKITPSFAIGDKKKKNILTIFGKQVPFPVQKPSEGDYVQYSVEHGGYGFFFPPRVILKGDRTKTSIVSSKDLTLVGIRVDMPSGFSVTCSHLSSRNCMTSSDISYSCNFSHSDFNINTAPVTIGSGCSGRLVRQFCIGGNSNIGILCSKIAIDNSHVVASREGMMVKNGSAVSLQTTHFVGNHRALFVGSNSCAAIPDTHFYSNHFAIWCVDRSSVVNDSLTPPYIIGCGTPFHIASSDVILNRVIESGNLYYAVVGGEVLIDESENKIDHVYVDGSRLITDDRYANAEPKHQPLPGMLESYTPNLLALGAQKVVNRELSKGLHPQQAIAKLQISTKTKGKFIE